MPTNKIEHKVKQKILQLHREGKTGAEIARRTGVSSSCVHYHCNLKRREQLKINQQRRAKTRHPYIKKYQHFFYCKRRPKIKPPVKSDTKQRLYDKVRNFARNTLMSEHDFTLEDVIKRFGESPICYLTGKPINIYQPTTYHFDHVIPVSKGGSNDLDNLGICTGPANKAKNDMTPNQFFNFCREVLEHQGYQVIKPQ